MNPGNAGTAVPGLWENHHASPTVHHRFRRSCRHNRRGERAQPDDVSRLGRTAHKFAVNVEMWWSRRPFLERLTEAARLGFPAIEFWPWEGKDIRAIAETCQKLKLEVAQFTAWGFPRD